MYAIYFKQSLLLDLIFKEHKLEETLDKVKRASLLLKRTNVALNNRFALFGTATC